MSVRIGIGIGFLILAVPGLSGCAGEKSAPDDATIPAALFLAGCAAG